MKWKYRAKLFIKVIAALSLLMIASAAFALTFLCEKSGTNPYYSFLIGDLTLISLLFGVITPFVNKRANETSKKFNTLVRQKVNRKDVLILISVLPLFHLIAIIVASFHDSTFIMIYTSSMTCIAILRILYHIYSITITLNFSTYSIKNIRSFSKMAKRDEIKKSIPERRKKKYTKIANNIFMGLPEEPNDTNVLGIYKRIMMLDALTLYINLHSSYSFLFDRFKLFKAYKQTLGVKLLKINPFNNFLESNNLSEELLSKLLIIFRGSDEKEKNNFLLEMTIPMIASNFKLNSGSTKAIADFIIKLDNKDKTQSQNTLLIYLLYLINDLNKTLNFYNMEQSIRNYKKLWKKYLFLGERVFWFYYKLKADRKVARAKNKSIILDEIIFQYAFQPIRLFFLIYKKMDDFFGKSLDPIVIINLENLLKELTNFKQNIQRYKNLDKDTKYHWLDEFANLIETKLEDAEINAEDIGEIKEDESIEYIYSAVREKIIEGNDLDYVKRNLHIFNKKLYAFFQENWDEKIGKIKLYNTNADELNLLKVSSVFHELISFCRLALIVYSKNETGFKEALEYLTTIKVASGRLSFWMNREPNITINEKYSLHKEVADNLYRGFWMDSVINKDDSVKEILKEKESYESKKKFGTGNK